MKEIAELVDKHVVALIACGKSKLDLDDGETAPAKDLYTSAYFGLKWDFSDVFCDESFILSAKHNLLSPEEQIEYYNASLTKRHDSYIGDEAVEIWGDDTCCELEEYEQQKPENVDIAYVILASGNYVDQINPFLNGKCVIHPFEERDFSGNGDQMGWMKEQIEGHTSKDQAEISSDWG